MIKFILGLILGFTMTVMYYSSKEEYRKENIMDLDEQELKATRKHNGADKSKEEKEKEKEKDGN